MRKLLVLGVFLLLPAISKTVHAQNYAPDRPGIANGSFITPTDQLGVEAGIQFAGDQFMNQFDMGQVLLRYGFNEELEFRALLNSLSVTDVANVNPGFQDMGLGLKYNLISEEGKPNVSALAELSLPVGSANFTNDAWIPSFGLLADHSINEDWALSSNLVYSFGLDNASDHLLFTLTPGVALTDHLSGYFGYALMNTEAADAMHWAEGGFALRLPSGIQLDFNCGFAAVQEAFFLGTGIAFAF